MTLAVAERFFATLKIELLSRHDWLTHATVRSAIFSSIETWYNPRRRHSTLAYPSPVAFEEVHRTHTTHAAA